MIHPVLSAIEFGTDFTIPITTIKQLIIKCVETIASFIWCIPKQETVSASTRKWSIRQSFNLYVCGWCLSVGKTFSARSSSKSILLIFQFGAMYLFVFLADMFYCRRAAAASIIITTLNRHTQIVNKAATKFCNIAAATCEPNPLNKHICLSLNSHPTISWLKKHPHHHAFDVSSWQLFRPPTNVAVTNICFLRKTCPATRKTGTHNLNSCFLVYYPEIEHQIRTICVNCNKKTVSIDENF